MKKLLALLLVACMMLVGMTVIASADGPVTLSAAPETLAEIHVAGNVAPEICFDPVDISACDTIEFDFWLQDADYFEKAIGQGQFELGSRKAGEDEYQDHAELAWNFNELKQFFETTNAGAWNHVVMPIATGHPQSEPQIDLTKVQRVRYYNVEIGEGVDTTVGIKNIVATKRFETISFDPQTSDYLVTGAHNNGAQYFTDSGVKVVYKSTDIDLTNKEKVEFSCKAGSYLLFSVSQDGSNYTDIYCADDCVEVTNRTFDLTSALDLTKKGDIYIRIGHSNYTYDAEGNATMKADGLNGGNGGTIFFDTPASLRMTVKQAAPVDPTPVDPTPATFDAVSSVAVAAVAALGVALVASKKRH